MKTILLKINDSIFGETESIIAVMKNSGNRYINEALDYYNKIQKRKILAQRLQNESILVKNDSIAILNVFKCIEYEYSNHETHEKHDKKPFFSIKAIFLRDLRVLCG